MRVLDLPIAHTIILDSIAWAIIQPAVAYLCVRLPAAAFDPGYWLFRTRKWERGGAIYARLLLVRRWKSLLPSGGTVFKGGFSMRRVASRRVEYLERWLRETCRAELTHWIAMLFGAVFFLWNPVELGLVMVLYAVAVNLPCIIVQRHNRPLIARILSKRQASTRTAIPA